jgi:hypothetical protein
MRIFSKRAFISQLKGKRAEIPLVFFDISIDGNPQGRLIFQVIRNSI